MGVWGSTRHRELALQEYSPSRASGTGVGDPEKADSHAKPRFSIRDFRKERLTQVLLKPNLTHPKDQAWVKLLPAC